MTFWGERAVVASISLFFNLQLRASHYISDAVDDAFILPLHVISLKVGHSGGLISWRIGDSGSLGFDCRPCLPKIGIVPGFVLKVEELLCFFNAHLIILCIAYLQIG